MTKAKKLGFLGIILSFIMTLTSCDFLLWGMLLGEMEFTEVKFDIDYELADFDQSAIIDVDINVKSFTDDDDDEVTLRKLWIVGPIADLDDYEDEDDLYDSNFRERITFTSPSYLASVKVDTNGYWFFLAELSDGSLHSDYIYINDIED